MKMKCFLIAALLTSQVLQAQSNIPPGDLDSLNDCMSEVVADSELPYSYLGNIYMMVADLQAGQPVTLHMLKFNEGKVDTLEIKPSKHLDRARSKLANLRTAKRATLIAPFIFLEDPKKGVNGNILIYDIVLNRLFQCLFKINVSSTRFRQQ
ncbi:hypothetical protein [Niabella aurantiaca]|uniref:hypothetical protein n=1 Tax=Niabella aurantiaca TaxID=379900 RepID=UPI0012F88E18|nr:hypothetical protein [Niabella aurantiaca]